MNPQDRLPSKDPSTRPDAAHVLAHPFVSGIKVWRDKTCLKPGVLWEEGFFAGFVNSRTFVCLLSKGAIHHPQRPRQNFANLNKASPCDNVFLEYRLALEQRDMVDAVETKLREHLDRQGLGAPTTTTASPREVLSVIGQNQGAFIEGDMAKSFVKMK
eukprot:gene6502-biopygen3130